MIVSAFFHKIPRLQKMGQKWLNLQTFWCYPIFNSLKTWYINNRIAPDCLKFESFLTYFLWARHFMKKADAVRNLIFCNLVRPLLIYVGTRHNGPKYKRKYNFMDWFCDGKESENIDFCHWGNCTNHFFFHFFPLLAHHVY